ncbi:hypothetical protein LV89_00622 [Arcicella aurantiaca]|uniref:Uncharacterized protein n=1 Tax=Arcicella aurantiaca TaxID=591202 RepID=A0A316EH77_9BACT|nr:hypothetical protein [Arcicella aurantiaca]PWK29068.1 hypothetical protein LV89_00622 [Arcicella aurantiaca]
MKTIFLNLSRRHFLACLGITSASVIVTPNTLIAKNSTQKLSIFVLDGDEIIIQKLSQHQDISLINSLEKADIIFLNSLTETNQTRLLQQYINLGKYLMINQNENNEALLKICQQEGVLCSSVSLSDDDVKLFNKVDYFESNTNQLFDFQKVATIINFLNSNTQKNKFRVFPVKSAESLIL